MSISQILCFGSLLRDGLVNRRRKLDRLRTTVSRGPRVRARLP